MGKRSRLNDIFRNMKQRCYNEKCKCYKYYGGKGVKICDEWLNSERVSKEDNATKGYLAFKSWALANGYKDDLTIDRINYDGNYEPSNCRWVTMKNQCNNRSNNYLITYKGETKNLTLWCDELGLDYYRIRDRLQILHWSVEKSFETPIRKCKQKVYFNVL